MIRIILILTLIITLTGCVTDEMTPPPSSFVDRTMTDYSFSDLMYNCTTYNDINLSSNSSPCTLPRRQAFIYETDGGNWSIKCCEFTDDSHLDDQYVEQDGSNSNLNMGNYSLENTNSLNIQNWNITEEGGNLTFSNNGTRKIWFDENGNIHLKGNLYVSE